MVQQLKEAMAALSLGLPDLLYILFFICLLLESVTFIIYRQTYFFFRLLSLFALALALGYFAQSLEFPQLLNKANLYVTSLGLTSLLIAGIIYLFAAEERR